MNYFKTLILILLLSAPLSLRGQVIFDPQYGLKTPSTLEIISLELSSDRTVINLSIENRVAGGYFCTDKNTYITTDSGTRLKLVMATGIPYCPTLHSFKKIGEKLYFTLIFPPFREPVKWFDLVEECGEMCYSILGVCTDKKLNDELDNCFLVLDTGDEEKAASMFESLLPGLEKENNGLTGAVYLNLITIYRSLGDEKADFYTKKLEESDVPHKEKFIKSISEIR